MGKKLQFSRIGTHETAYRLEIQYLESRIGEIHSSHFPRNLQPGSIPIIFSKEDSNYQTILDLSRRMESVYPPTEWKYVIAIVNSSCQTF